MASIIPGYHYDIFISYRQKDNKGDRWVSEFVEALKTELESTFKEEISVYFDINPHDGLLETHDVDASLKDKLNCLVFIPIISRTYCDPKSFAWEHEFKAFVEQASKDQVGLKVKLPNGNVASRVLPVRIHDLDFRDNQECESVLGGVLRGVDFIYKEPGVNRHLTIKDNEEKNLNHTNYRNQINKVALAVKEVIYGLKTESIQAVSEKTQLRKASEEVNEEHVEGRQEKKFKTVISKLFPVILITTILVIAAIIAYPKIFKQDTLERFRASGEQISVAMLPLRYLSNDTTRIHFCSGMQEEINGHLSRIGTLSVKSRSSTERYKDSDKTSKIIGEELRANFLIEGSVALEKNEIKVWIQLIVAETDEHLWAKEYQEELSDIFTIQSEIAKDIASELKVVLTTEERTNIDKKPTENIDAYNHYLIGNYLLNQSTEDSFRKAIDHYHKAIELDSEFAEAYCNLAYAYLQLMSWFSCSSTDYIPKVKSNLLKALEIDNKLGEAYYMLGVMKYLYEWDWEEAEKNFRKGLDLNPDFIAGMIEYANFLTSMGRFDESKRIINRTIELDPLNPLNYNELSWTLWTAGELEQALGVRNTSLKLDPDHLQTLWAEMTYYAELGQYDKALSVWEKLKGNDQIIELSPYLLADAGVLMESVGRLEEAITYLNELKRRADEEGYKDTFPQALIYIAIGENEKALELLEQAFKNRSFAMVQMNVNKKFDPLRSYDRFQNILKKMNFP